MMDSLARLIADIPPPQHPMCVSLVGWESVERSLGFALPRDYKQFISTYGSGIFQPAELIVYNLLNFTIHAEYCRNLHEFALDAETLSITFPQFHASTPVLTFGADALNSAFFWAQDGKADDWYVIVVKNGTTYYRFRHLALTDFLVALFLEKDPQLTSLWYGEYNSVPQAFEPILEQ